MSILSRFVVAACLLLVCAATARADFLFEKNEADLTVKGQEPMTVLGRLRRDLRFTLPPGIGAGDGGGALSCGDSINADFDGTEPTIAVGGGEGHLHLYTFELSTQTTVTIQMASGPVDTFLLVADAEGAVIGFNDDCTAGNYDLSCIEILLQAGSYLIGCTTYSAGERGPYALLIECSEEVLCEECSDGSVACNSTTTVDLGPGPCSRANGAPLQTYELNIGADGTQLTINLSSEDVDTYLILTDGDCVPISANDDCPDRGLNSCISEVLDAGTYRVGVSSFGADEAGPVEVSIECIETKTVPATSPWGGSTLALGLLAVASFVLLRRRTLGKVS